MTYKEAREYLRPIYENAQIYNYAVALGKSIEALELAERRGGRDGDLVTKLCGTKSESKRQMLDDAADAIESLEAELAEAERRAKDRDGLFARLIDDLKLVAKEGGTPCGLCRWAYAPLPCRDGPDYPCEKCIHGGCVCHSCRDYDKWLWRGMPEVKHESN